MLAILAASCIDSSAASAPAVMDPSQWIASHSIKGAVPYARTLMEAQEREIAAALQSAFLDRRLAGVLRELARESRDDVERKIDVRQILRAPQLRHVAERLRRVDVRRHLAPSMALMLPPSQGGCLSHEIICSDGDINPALPPMDIYMPIDEHRDSWTGTEPVVVVPILDDDTQWVVAFGPGAQQVLVHIDSAPPVHTWVVTPIERTADVWAHGPQGARTWTRIAPIIESVSHVRSVLSYEPRLLGRPEFKLLISTGFTCVPFEFGCKWKANKAFDQSMSIPAGTWPKRRLTGNNWSSEWREIEGGPRVIVNWSTAPAPLFTPFVGARSPLMISCIEEDGSGTVKGKPKVKHVTSAGWSATFIADVDHKNADDDCGLHMMFPPGNGFPPALFNVTISVPSGPSDFGQTSGGFGWFGFGVPTP